MSLAIIDLGVGYFVIFIACPALLCLPVFTFSRRWHPFGRYVFSVIGTWFLVNVYHEFAVAPVSHMRAWARGDLAYDGVGSAAGILIIGIVIPAVVGIPFYLYSLTTYRDERGESRERSPLGPTKPVEPTGTGRFLYDPLPNQIILLHG